MNKLRYGVELGVNDPETGWRECVGEIGPYLTKRGAARAMRAAFGKRADSLRRFGAHGENDHLIHLPVAGATIEHYSWNDGTFESWDYEAEHASVDVRPEKEG